MSDFRAHPSCVSSWGAAVSGTDQAVTGLGSIFLTRITRINVSIRTLTLNRKDFLFSGSHEAAPAPAILILIGCGADAYRAFPVCRMDFRIVPSSLVQLSGASRKTNRIKRFIIPGKEFFQLFFAPLLREKIASSNYFTYLLFLIFNKREGGFNTI